MSSNRRRFLRAVATGSAVAIAGCSGGGPAGTDEPTEGSAADGGDTSTATAGATATEPDPATTEGDDDDDGGLSTVSPTSTLTGTGSGESARWDGETQAGELAAGDGDADDEFGWAVDLSGDGQRAVVGAPGDEDPNGRLSGSAYVFERAGSGWSGTKLLPEDGAERENFGSSVSIAAAESVVAVGASRAPGGSGSGEVTVYERSGGEWARTTTVTPADDEDGAEFGATTTLSDDGRTLLVGAPFHTEPNGNRGGGAYVFERSSSGEWTQAAKLAATDGASNDLFGLGLDLSGDGTVAVVGAPSASGPNGEYGAGYACTFERSNGSWGDGARLPRTGIAANEAFGMSIAVTTDASRAFVAASGESDPNGAGAGTVEVYDRTSSGWTHATRVALEAGRSQDRFGAAIAADDGGDTLVAASIGAFGGVGAAHHLERDGDSFTHSAAFVADDVQQGDAFAGSVAVDDDAGTVLAGVPRDDEPNGEDSGSAYVFDAD